jgi:thiamine transporter
MNLKKLVFGGMCVALSFILSYFKIFSMPQGGSITVASMLPLILYAFVCGPVAGITAGVAYGFLQFFQDAYSAHWMSIFLDYPLAFGCLGLAGCIPSKFKSLEVRFVLASLVAVVGRLIMHVLSGAIFFHMYAPEGMNPWFYSLFVYNGPFMSVEFVLVVLIGLILLKTPVYTTLKKNFAN